MKISKLDYELAGLGYPILLQDSIRLFHCRLEPSCIGVILDAAPAAVAVIHQIRWIGEDEIDAAGGHFAHHLDAIALRNRVDELVLILCLHGFDLLCGPGVISQDTHPEGARDGRSQGGRDAFSGETFRGNRNPQGVRRGERSRIPSAAGRGLPFSRGA